MKTVPVGTLRALLTYDPRTGVLRWKRRGDPHWDPQFAGQVAGTTTTEGYRRITIYESSYAAHRIVWAMNRGHWPVGALDHRNGDRSDNRIENLRECTLGQNSGNALPSKRNRLGVKGVYFDAGRGLYRAQIMHNRIKKNLGSYKTLQEARRAYRAAAFDAFGRFARTQHGADPLPRGSIEQVIAEFL